VWLTLHLDCHRSAASSSSDSIKCFPSVPTNCPRCEISPASSPLPQDAAPVLLPFFILLPSFHILQSCVWIYIFLSSGQGLLPVLSWCSMGTSVFVDIFLMHPGREEILGGKCLWRKARWPWRQGTTAESCAESGAITVGSLTPHAGASS